jgi:hypothetical protein
MSSYIIYFNQQWVGDHSDEWFASRGPLARAVVEEMRAAKVLVFGGGLKEEFEDSISFNELGEIGGFKAPDAEFLGGLTIVNVESEEEAIFWGAKIAVACGWPQIVRKIK